VLFLLVTLVIATVLRFHDITRYALWVDEYFSLQHSSGNGLSHWRLIGSGVHSPPPDLIGRFHRQPWSHIVSGLKFDDVHPPLYQFCLRAWRDTFGDSDETVRSIGAIFSVLAIAVLFDVARLLHGITSARWAALLATFAIPQIHWAQDARPYTLLLLLALGAVDAVARLLRYGPAWRRVGALALCTLGAGLTHYYGIVAMAGLAVYVAVRLRGAALRQAFAGFAIAGALFLVLWAPAMWQQRHSALAYTGWLNDPAPGHTARTFRRLALLPASFLNDPMSGAEAVASFGAVLFVLPFAFYRRRPEVFLWGCWLAATIVMPLTSDLTKQWKQLDFLRYTSLAAPAVYVLLSTILSGKRGWLRHALPATALLSCLISLPRAYSTTQTPKPDYRRLAALLSAHASRDDVIVIYAPPDHDPGDPGNWFLPLSRYATTLPQTAIFLVGPPDERERGLLNAAPAVWTLTLPIFDIPPEVTAGRVPGPWRGAYNLPTLRQWLRPGSATTSSSHPTSAP
jgi:hypothetical protein